ncbi:hypothetical protein CPLU01_05912 [Colletotrichum plurivorum]|uniref:Uncharacterized protein n=1 Tax=Colletotrichum plurivorum TaxID=2175906 RepID=A0A8H6KKV9_9PEZI|nr:hypothetical protein CPLU01_05912 [Colletotrichum plurivorum]
MDVDLLVDRRLLPIQGAAPYRTTMDVQFEPHFKLDLFPRVSPTRSGFAGRSARSASALPYSSTQAPPARSMKMVYQ